MAFFSEVERISKVKMAGESLKDIGINLSNEFQALVWNYSSGWLIDDNILSSENWDEIALLEREIERFEGAIDEAKVWEKLLTTGFIPPDLGSPNKSNLGEETTSDDRQKIHPYLETWKKYESFVNLDRQISTGNGQSSYTEKSSPPDSPSLSIGDTSPTHKVTSQRAVAPGEGQKNHPGLSNFSDNVAEISQLDAIITSRDLGASNSPSIADTSPTPKVTSQRVVTPEEGQKKYPVIENFSQNVAEVLPIDRIINSRNSVSSNSPSIADTSPTPKVTSQRVVTPEEGQKKYPVIGKFSENAPRFLPSDTITTSRDLGFDKYDSEENYEVLSKELGLSKSDSYQIYESLPVDEPEIKRQYLKLVNLQNLDDATQKISHRQRDFANNSLGIKGLKDLSAFLASQPDREHIIEADLLTKYSAENIDFSKSELSDNQREISQNTVSYFSDFSEGVEAKGGLLESKESEVENKTEIADDSRHRYAMVQPALSRDRTPELEMEIILEAVAQEINREYRRFYGE